mmetsp:Transcript_9167/g.10698  ORF Transcript_9167/g.10698 Transcript_9167/m.10698 type:complete len:564 (-) Transcript_9167:274-1965(-)|eukprot:CAMPEP_0170817634 /NCGR_PEP_ID=MMETSP0733-20121128/40147_1 /TAXON_ID=186038 /ORGANISM="Fragilariopsis kerguelensis, Strain L26-C5" /LENGTH=563 /DNA_ID=CAMNT_0011177373 /DNA_START=111 /DNA_END=1802 /DNA_ORIENTATION=-
MPVNYDFLPVDFPHELLLENEDDIQHPNLFSEVYSMAYASAAIFALADVREAARKKIIDVQEITSLPVTAHAIEKAFIDNKDTLRNHLKPADFSFMESLSYITMEVEGGEKLHSEENDLKRDKMNLLHKCTLHYFGDDNVENDCVYLILKNPINKRLIVCFRGSITYQDWIKDSKVFVGDIPNPLSDRPDQPPTIGVHLGFKEYLYGISRKVSISQLGAIRSSLGSYSYNSSTSSDINESEDKFNTANANAAVVGTGMNMNMNETTAKHIHRMSLNLGLAVSKLKEKAGLKGPRYSLSLANNTDTSQLDADNNDNDQDDDNGGGDGDGDGDHQDNSDDDDNDDVNDDNDSERDSNTQRTRHRCRLDKILEEIDDLHKQNEEYKIYITGHSLGGALGLLLALEAGTRFGKSGLPVTYVGIANPRGGTETFRDAVAVLEKEGRLRCICVHGHLDLVPMIPTSPPNRTASKRFCQSGIEMVLEPDQFVMRYSPRADDNYIQRVGLALSRAHKIAERHHYMTYLKELRNFAKPLRELYLNDYYNIIYDSETFPCSERKLTPMVVTLN